VRERRPQPLVEDGEQAQLGADRKWYRNWAVAELLREALDDFDIDWPKADYDVEAEKRRLAGA
jgi:hypothetical protein